MKLEPIDVLEIHKIAYLSSKGWIPSDYANTSCSWELKSKTDPDLDAWYSDIDDAYDYQRELDEEEEKKNAGR